MAQALRAKSNYENDIMYMSLHTGIKRR